MCKHECKYLCERVYMYSVWEMHVCLWASAWVCHICKCIWGYICVHLCFFWKQWIYLKDVSRQWLVLQPFPGRGLHLPYLPALGLGKGFTKKLAWWEGRWLSSWVCLLASLIFPFSPQHMLWFFFSFIDVIFNIAKKICSLCVQLSSPTQQSGCTL